MKRSRIFVTMALCAFLLGGCATPIREPQSFRLINERNFRFEEGAAFPIASAPSRDGGYVPFSESRKKIVLIYGFDCTCKYSAEALNALAKDKNIKDGSADLIVIFLQDKSHHLSEAKPVPVMKNVYAVNVNVSPQWDHNLFSLPVVMTVDKRGMIVHKVRGWSGESYEKLTW